jgi:hypothetical protein
VTNSIEGILNNEELKIKWVEPTYKDRWFADPFILDANENNITLLVEEFFYPIKRAGIAKIIINRKNNRIVSTKTILTLPTHMSYPAILRKDGKIFIYPESGKSGKLKLYEYDKNTDELKEECVLINEYVADATYTNYFGEDLIFCTKLPDINEKRLCIYKKGSDNLYKFQEEIFFEDNVARMAGDFFSYNGIIYRPAQDCNKSYGHGTVIQKVINRNGKWIFHEVRRYFSNNKKYPLGIHTLNMYKDVIVVDAVGYRWPKTGAFINFLITIIKKIIRRNKP